MARSFWLTLSGADILGLPLVVVVAHGGRMLFIIIIVAQLLGCH